MLFCPTQAKPIVRPLKREARPLALLFLVGLLIRVLLMPFAMHTDVDFVGDIVYTVQTALRFVVGHPTETTYPPLALLTVGAYTALWFPPDGSPVPEGEDAQIRTLADPGIFRKLFTVKGLFLFFDLLTALLLVRVVEGKHDQRAAAAFWLLNPVTIYSSYIHGQFDAIPVFFVVLSLYIAKAGRPIWSAFWLGIAACYKIFPFFFLLPLVIVRGRSWREKSMMIAWSCVPYLVFMLALSRPYSSSTAIYPAQLFKAGYDLGSGTQVYFFFVVYGVLLWWLHQVRVPIPSSVWRVSFAILLVYYQFSYFDLHYWVWIMPFAAFYWVERPQQAKLFYAVIGLCLLVLITPTPLARFLAPISPRFFLRLPSLLEVLNRYLPTMFIVNVVRSLLAGTCFYLAYRLVRGIPSSQNDIGAALADEPVVA